VKGGGAAKGQKLNSLTAKNIRKNEMHPTSRRRDKKAAGLMVRGSSLSGEKEKKNPRPWKKDVFKVGNDPR